MRESCDWNVDYIHQSIRSLAWTYSSEGMLYADAVCCLLYTYDLDDEAIAMYKKASVDTEFEQLNQPDWPPGDCQHTDMAGLLLG